MSVLINGQKERVISVADRGFNYGDGVFRTLVIQNGFIPNWAQHLAILERDAKQLGIPFPTASLWENDVLQLSQENLDLQTAVIKLTLSRGIGQRGYAAPEAPIVTRVSQIVEWKRPDLSMLHSGVKVELSDVRLGWQPLLAGAKHLNRLENVLAKSRLKNAAAFDGLLLDQSGCVIEGIQTNLIMQMQNGQWLTPDLSRCGVAGLTRQLVLDQLRAENQTVEIGDVLLAELLEAKHLWLMNSLNGVVPVAKLYIDGNAHEFMASTLPFNIDTQIGWRVA
ncbi:aminodeoxychorismate lyase [Leeia sp. TBRC 13508]|uniref:aminodeoxychorismate lyase n=1 Tax=Leeia speluncae TaxID=2884804 RepID=A0ABS8D8C8_9NEIS|nr:aminodeoxychorismate lyase [Leeia speluncae]MCB6184377.1 aminodeoxychorismate lyase [Leeia speluncae]